MGSRVQADAESVARTVVVFEEVDNLADEDRGFLAALSAIVADSKVGVDTHCEQPSKWRSWWRVCRLACFCVYFNYARGLVSVWYSQPDMPSGSLGQQALPGCTVRPWVSDDLLLKFLRLCFPAAAHRAGVQRGSAPACAGGRVPAPPALPAPGSVCSCAHAGRRVRGGGPPARARSAARAGAAVPLRPEVCRRTVWHANSHAPGPKAFSFLHISLYDDVCVADQQHCWSSTHA